LLCDGTQSVIECWDRSAEPFGLRRLICGDKQCVHVGDRVARHVGKALAQTGREH